MAEPDPMYAEEPCHYCDGTGQLDGDECGACAGTGLLYTEEAIRLQVDAQEAVAAETH